MKKAIALMTLTFGLAQAASVPSGGTQPLVMDMSVQVMALCTVNVSSQVADGSNKTGTTFGKYDWKYNSLNGVKWEGTMTSHTLRCQRGTNVTMDQGGNGTLKNGSNTLNYTYKSSIAKKETADGDIWTPTVSVDIPAQQWTSPVGVYKDTVSMDISWN